MKARAELRRLQAELRLSEAERKDRAWLEQLTKRREEERRG
jgi:hypothetical protein